MMSFHHNIAGGGAPQNHRVSGTGDIFKSIR